MRNIFKDKVVIVTGASSGIGLAVSCEFAKAGSKVVMAARSAEKLAAKETEMRSLGYDVMACPTDVTDEQQCRNLVDKTVERYGTVNILINNAGISMRAMFSELDLSVIKRLMDVNFWGTVYCTRYALPFIVKNRGSIVGVSSVAGFHGLPGRTGYSASKFAMHGFLETIRIENLHRHLHVMIIAPGFTASEVRKHALLADGSEQGNSPRAEGRMMTPERVARALLKGIRKKKRNKILTLEGQLTALFQRIVPTFVDYMYFREMAREPDSPLK